MSGSGHTLLLEATSGETTLGNDNSRGMGCHLSTSSSCEGFSIPEQPSAITVYLHGGISECLPFGDTSKSVEEIIKKLLNIHYPTVGPAAIHLFGLAVLDTKKNDRFLWKSPRCMIKDLQGQTTNNPHLKIFVRVRFIPAKDRLSKLKIFGSDVIKYLYHQLREDLISERIKSVYGSRNQLTPAKCRGLAVLNILINSRVEKKPVDTILDQHKLKEFLPPSECVVFLKRMKLEKNMKDHLRKFDQTHPELSTDIEELMSGYVRDILKEMLDYSVEQYDANVLDMGKPVPKKILIDVHHKPSGVFIDGIPFSEIEKLCTASITPNYLNNSNTWNVHLDRTNGRPEVLEFASTELAESFVSCLVGYYRLIHDFYFSLCSQMEPLSLQALKRIKSHGPIETSRAITKLNSKMDDQECYYLCKQDVTNFDHFILAYPSKGQIITELVQHESGLFYLLRDREKSFPDPGLLVPYIMQNNILSNNMIRLKPNVEACGVLKRLFMDEMEPIPEEDMNHKEDFGLAKQPIIIPEAHLEMKRLIGNGKFTQVYEGIYRDTEAVAVKLLRMETSPQQLYNCLEPFLYALRQQMKFRDVKEPAYFAGIRGVCMTMPIKIVMDYAKEGSLLHFFTHRQPDQPIYLRHLVYAATQVAQGLFQLEERDLYHGNICCQNILVYRYDISEIMVKIGDPGMIQVYECPSMANNEKVNKKRIPWIAPELLDKQPQHCGNMKSDKKEQPFGNMKSDIYAFGTTVWEMFALGENPIEKPPLSSLSFEQQKNFYRSKDQCNLPPTEGLKILTTDSIHLKKCKEAMLSLIQRCRVSCPDDRPSAKELVRDLHTLTASYAGEYHDYEEILDDDRPLYSAETSVTSHDADSDEDVPDILHSYNPTPKFVDPKPRTAPGKRPQASERPMTEVPVWEPTSLRSPVVATSLAQHGQPPSRPLPQPVLNHPTMIAYNRLRITTTEVIGEGHYGTVKKGHLKKCDEWFLIAAKCLKGNEYTSVLQSREFKHEAEMMSELKHPNIVRFHGICNNMIIMEYVDNGAMSMFLRERKKSRNLVSADKLMAIMLDIAEGMKYMADKNIIHSDLAARNILMTRDIRAKISDFGLARHLGNGKDYYRRSKEKELPASWCSPEGLSTLKFTILGDVWSYGVVLWEAYTHGSRPMYGEDIKNIFQHIQSGQRLKRPDEGQGCPDRVWDLMKWCWKYVPLERPSFQQIQEECSEILEEMRSQAGVEEIHAGPSIPEQAPQIVPANVGVTSPGINRIISHDAAIMPVTRDRDPIIVTQIHTDSPPRGILNGQKDIGITSPESNKPTSASPSGFKLTSPESAKRVPGDNNRVTSPVVSSPVSPITRPFDRELPRKPRDDLHFLISQSDLQVMKDVVLGQGEFGCVYKGRYKQRDVAVKILDEGFLKKNTQDNFWEEVDVFGRASHPNIVTFIGFIRDAQSLVMEFVPKGSLSAYLTLCKTDKATLSLRQSLGFICDIASGMKYLVQQAIIHCDLAARNILLMDNMMAKISDFGLSKVLCEDKDYYLRGDKKSMPCWWCAPEVLLKRKLTHESDVWSYGIVAWEIFTLGEHPNICEVGGQEIIELIHIGIDHMKKGFRLKKEKTKNCPDDVYELMVKCWAWEPKDRPQFSSIHEQCLNFLSKYGETIQP